MNTRRDFLKMSAAGACGLAALSNMSRLQAATSAGSVTPRFIFLRKSNGTAPEWLTPPSLKSKAGGENAMEVDLDKIELADWMQPLDKHKENLTILQNLSARMCGMGHSTYQSPLTVSKTSQRINTIPRASIDVVLGSMIPSPFGHIEFTCDNNETGIIRGNSSIGPKQPNSAFASPGAAYKNLFSFALDDNDSQVKNTLTHNLNSFMAKNANSNSIASHGYTHSIESLIERNKKLVSMSATIKKHLPEISKDILNDKYTTVEKQFAFVDVILSSLYSGLTNSVTLTLDTLETTYDGLVDATIKLHPVGHNTGFGGLDALGTRNKLRTHHMQLVNRLVDGLKKMPEGKGNMFDNTVIMYLPENGEKHHSNGSHVPFVILSGKDVKLNIARRFIQLPGYNQAGHKTLGNFYTTLLNAYGNPIEHYGDLDVKLKIDQKGSIKQFLN